MTRRPFLMQLEGHTWHSRRMPNFCKRVPFFYLLLIPACPHIWPRFICNNYTLRGTFIRTYAQVPLLQSGGLYGLRRCQTPRPKKALFFSLSAVRLHACGANEEGVGSFCAPLRPPPSVLIKTHPLGTAARDPARQKRCCVLYVCMQSRPVPRIGLG